MSTPNFESQVLTQLESYIKLHHGGLQVAITPSGSVEISGMHLPNTDMVVHSPTTGKILGIQIRPYGETLPFGIYPQLKSYQSAFRRQNGDFVTITPSLIPEALTANVAQSGMNIISSQSPGDILVQLEPKLKSLETSG